MSENEKKPCDCPNQEDVCNRLLDVAERMFCEKGFHGTSVRELTTEAGCNVAAVNYHFGTKEKLYSEMFRRQFEFMISENLTTLETVMNGPEPTVEKLTRAIIEPAVYRVVNDEANSKVLRMLVREALDQQVELESICKEIKGKFFDYLGQSLKQLVPGLPDDPDQLVLVVCSFDGVVLHPFLFYEMYTKILPSVTPDRLIDHMVKFIAAAIYGYAKS